MVLEADAEILLQLVEGDVSAGFASWLDGGLEEARQRFGDLIGFKAKLIDVPARLIGDSSISNANAF